VVEHPEAGAAAPSKAVILFLKRQHAKERKKTPKRRKAGPEQLLQIKKAKEHGGGWDGSSPLQQLQGEE